MNKRDSIIFTAAQLIHEHGYHNVGIKSILDELSIPKGSFYHYFKSKEDLGLAIIDFYIQDTTGLIYNAENSLQGLKEFFNVFFNRLIDMEMKKGCPVGNLILELSDENESFRLKLLSWYKIVEDWATQVIKAYNISDANGRAKALIAAYEGTILLAKLEKDTSHFEVFNKYTFDNILK